MLFSEPPAHLAKLCASKPIHVIVATLLVASVSYLTIFDHYLTRISSISLDSATFFQDVDTGGWRPVNNVTDFKTSAFSSLADLQGLTVSVTPDSASYSSLSFNSTPHWALTPVIFKTRHSEIEIPSSNSSRFIAGPTESQKFFLSEYSANVVLPRAFENSQGDVFKKRESNRLGRYFEYVKSAAYSLKQSAEGAEPLDVILLTLAYAAMLFTVGQLFYEMRKAGSKFWLASGSLLSSMVAFLFGIVFTSEVLDIHLSLSSLTEGIPFLVAAMGVRHKVAYTVPIVEAIRKDPERDIADTMGEVIMEKTAAPLVRQQLAVALCFLAVATGFPQMAGLHNFCVCTAVVMVSDLVVTFTFYSAIMSLKAQINTVHRQVEITEALEEEGVSASVAQSVAEQDTVSSASKPIFKHDRNVLFFKGAMIAGFLALHLFALGTSWLYDDLSDYSHSLVNTSSSHGGLDEGLSGIIAGKIPLGEQGTLLTVLPTVIYRRATLLTDSEDFVFNALNRLSKAIRDPYISKFLLLITGISFAINVYLLNVARTHLFKKLVRDAEAVTDKPAKHTKVKARAVAKKPASITPVVSPDNVKDNQIVSDTSSEEDEQTLRPLDELVSIMKSGNVKQCTDAEVCELATNGKMPLYALEKHLGDPTRAVGVRRRAIAKLANAPVLNTERLPWQGYDYERVFGACCENVVGYMPLPVGIAGPIIIDGVPYHIPMATTEGCLVASTTRGCKAINAGGGVETVLTADGMTRGPCVRFGSLARTGAAKKWLDSAEGQKTMKAAFDSTSRFARLQSMKTAMAGNLLYVRFKTTTGDAMGMNMISKGTEFALKHMQEKCGFEDMQVVTLSGNYCTDKKPAAINWIDGRGKSVVASATIPADVVKRVLKSDVDALVRLNIDKNLVGSAMAGSVGGFNAHAANLVTAVFLATGEDPAQNVESSNCITLAEKTPEGDLCFSVSMPSIEVGTIGGGTILEPQASMLDLLGVRGPHPTEPGANARKLATIVASAVLAAELSLCSALAAGHLTRAHLALNRKAAKPVEQKKPDPKDLQRLRQGSKICIRS